MYRKLKISKTLCILNKSLVLSIIYNNCGSKDNRRKESTQILKIVNKKSLQASDFIFKDKSFLNCIKLFSSNNDGRRKHKSIL